MPSTHGTADDSFEGRVNICLGLAGPDYNDSPEFLFSSLVVSNSAGLIYSSPISTHRQSTIEPASQCDQHLQTNNLNKKETK